MLPDIPKLTVREVNAPRLFEVTGAPLKRLAGPRAIVFLADGTFTCTRHGTSCAHVRAVEAHLAAKAEGRYL